jgi:hypothetical protein
LIFKKVYLESSHTRGYGGTCKRIDPTALKNKDAQSKNPIEKLILIRLHGDRIV